MWERLDQQPQALEIEGPQARECGHLWKLENVGK